MVQQVLQRFGFTCSSPQSTPLPTGHSLSAPPSDESVEPSGPYPELVGSLITSDMGLVLGGRARVVLSGHADASWVDELATQRSSQGYTFSLGSGSVSLRSTRSSFVLSSSCEAEIYAGTMAAQELRWLTYLLTDLGETPRSPPVLYVDNKAMLALCQEHRLEHKTKHIALRLFLARELQQCGQLRLAYVASQANTADVFTKALQPCDHQRSRIENDVCVLEHATGKLVALKDPDPLGASPTEVDEARFEKAQLAAKVMTKGLFHAVVKGYSTSTIASLGRLVLPFLFPDLPSFPRVADLIMHLRSLDAQLRSAARDANLLATNPLAMWMTLYLLSTRLPDRFSTACDHFLTVNPMSLTIDLFEKRLTTVEDLARSLAAASSAVLPPIFEGCAPLFLASSDDLASVAIAYEVAAVAFGNKGGKKSGMKGGGGGSGGGGGGGSGGGGGGGSGGGGGGGSGGGSGRS
ncbi:unnamed protein product [Closterium sp. NIES-53]